MKRPRLTAWLALGLVVAVAVAGCARPGAPPKKEEPNVATSARAQEVMVFWDPRETFSNEIVAMQNMYETLLRYDPSENKFIRVLATDYSVSPDGLVWQFELRKGVKFHTGNKFDAQAVKYSIEETMRHGKGASFIWTPVKEVRVIDEYTVEIELQYPAPLDVIVAAGYCAYIYDPAAMKEKGHDWFLQAHDAGTGPYTVESWKHGDELVLTKFEEYWGGWKENQFDKLVFKVVPEAATRRQMLEAGQLDFVEMLPVEHIEDLKTNPEIVITVSPAFQNLLGLLNTKKAPLNNKLVRQAISCAFPYDAVVQHVMHGYARQSRGPVPYGLWGHAEDLPQYKYDLEKAKELLEEAGYPNGGFKLLLTYAAGDENERRVAELFKAELAKLNIELEIRGMPWESQWDLAKSRNPKDRQDIFLFYWWPDYADPYSFLLNMFHSEEEIVFNLCYYSDPTYDRLIDEAHKISGANRSKAIEMYGQAQEILVEEAAALFIYDQQYVRALRRHLKGYKDNPAYPHVVFFHDCHKE